MELKRKISTKTGRYAVLGTPGANISHLWIVCHGYGQLAARFIERFRCLQSDDTLIIAPEGLHRFYIGGSSGKVGASWMTKEDRLSDINDYVIFLDSIHDEMRGLCKSHHLKVNVLGYSQGTATISRWLCRGKVNPDNLILWAGQLAHDLNPEIDNRCFKNLDLHLVFGDNDEYYDEAKIAEHLQFIDQFKKEYSLIRYSGGHQIDSATLLKLKNKLHDKPQ